MKYRGEIDGLRALAVVPVILFHAEFAAFGGGFVGVDVFFVISGYLITGIILEDLRQGRFSIAAFYERRARRILPALFLVMLCCLPPAWLWLLPLDLKDFGKSLSATMLFASNIVFWRSSNYFEPSAELKPLLHTWSLAVEEQYYVVFPLILALAWRLGWRRMSAIVLGLALASLGLATWQTQEPSAAAFYLLPTRGWELMVGAGTAVYVARRGLADGHGVRSELAAACGLVLLLVSIFAFDRLTPWPGPYTLVPTLGTALLILCASPSTTVGRLLAGRACVGLGLISYSAYLWHHPLFAFARHRSLTEPSPVLMAALSVLALALAWLSWKYVEMPFRDRRRFDRRQIFGLSLLGSVVLFGLGMAGYTANGFSSRVPASVDRAQFLNGISVPGVSSACDGPDLDALSSCTTAPQPAVMAWGDSFAMQLVPTLEHLYPGAGLLQYTRSTCNPLLDVAQVVDGHGLARSRRCLAFNRQLLTVLDRQPSIRVVVLSSPFHNILSAELLDAQGHLHPRRSAPTVAQHLAQTIRTLEARGLDVLVVAPPPVPEGWAPGDCARKALFHHGSTDDCNYPLRALAADSVLARDFLRDFFAREPFAGARLVELEPVFCDATECIVGRDGRYFYGLEGHLSLDGALEVARHPRVRQVVGAGTTLSASK